METRRVFRVVDWQHGAADHPTLAEALDAIRSRYPKADFGRWAELPGALNGDSGREIGFGDDGLQRGHLFELELTDNEFDLEHVRALAQQVLRNRSSRTAVQRQGLQPTAPRAESKQS